MIEARWFNHRASITKISSKRGARDGLSRHRISAEQGPVSFSLVILVRDRAFDHENVRHSRCALAGLAERLHKLVSIFVSQKRIIEIDFQNPEKSARSKALRCSAA